MASNTHCAGGSCPYWESLPYSLVGQSVAWLPNKICLESSEVNIVHWMFEWFWGHSGRTGDTHIVQCMVGTHLVWRAIPPWRCWQSVEPPHCRALPPPPSSVTETHLPTTTHACSYWQWHKLCTRKSAVRNATLSICPGYHKLQWGSINVAVSNVEINSMVVTKKGK